MLDQDKSKQELIEELAEMRRRVAVLETADIERKQAEEALRLSEGRYRALAESTRDIIFILDRQGTLLYANQAASQCIGIPAGDIVGKRQVDLFPPEMARSQIEVTERVFATGEVIEYDDVFHFGPAEVWLRIHLIPIRDEAGQIISVMGVCHNITERKQTELALVEREAQLREAQDVANLGFYVVDLKTGCCTSSSVLDRIFGIPVDHPRTIDEWANLVHPDDRQEMLDGFKNAVDEKKPSELEYRIVRYGDKQVRWVHGLGRLQFNEDGQPISMLGTIQDFTERKQAEEERDRDRAILSATIDCLPFEFFAIGTDGQYMLQNEVSRRHAGAAIGRRPEDCAPDEYTRQLWLDNNRRAFAGERVEGEVEAHVRGETRTFHNIIGPIREDGKVCGILGVNVDITERKRAEEALRLSEAKYRRLHQSMRDAFVSVGMDGRIQEYNEAYRQMLGYEPEELLRLRYQDITPEKWHSYEAEIVQKQTLPRGVSAVYEKEYRQKDGTIFPVELRTFLIEDDLGQPIAMWAIVRDITERKRAEEALRKAHDELEQRVRERTAELAKANEDLRQSHDELRTLYDGMPDGLLAADIETKKFVRCNAAMGRMLGYSEEEVLARSVMDIHPADELPCVLETFHALVEGRQRIGQDVPVLRKDGSVFHADVTHNEIELNGWRCTVGFFRDITERKQAEEALRRSEERYELAVRGAGVGIWDWDIRTGKLYFSPRWKMLFGYDENDIGESLEDWARLLHPDERDWMLKFLADFLAGTSPTVTVEYRLRHKDGSYRWIVATGLVVRDEQGKAYRFVGSHGDITDRKKAEQALAKEHRNLRYMLRASDNERQLIAYEIHDGLAQQLAGAIMQFQAFDHLKETKPKQAADAYHAAITMLRQGHFETRRLIAGVRPPILDEAGVAEAISHLVHEVSREEGPKIENYSRVDFDRLDPTLENAIYRIAQEALTNACKHSQSERISVSLLQRGDRGDRLRIEIRDWGVGFDLKAVPQSHFGLEGMRQRARLLGGKCSIRSKAGKGTRIMVELPVVPRDEEG